MLKLKLCLIIGVLLSVNLFAEGTEPTGSGTQDDPYQVEILDNLLWISTNEISWDKQFIQIADINASDTHNWYQGFSPIGVFPNPNNPFSGCYDGQNFTIDSLYINTYGSLMSSALFGSTDQATIENLGLTGLEITGYYFIGGLVGYCINSTINNCYCTGSINGGVDVGGLFGSISNSEISYCNYAGSVDGDRSLGGLAGTASGSEFNNCYSSADVTGYVQQIGGLFGGIWATKLHNCHYNYEEVLIHNEHIITVGALNNDMYETWINNNLYLNIDDYLMNNGTDYLISSVDDFKTLLAFGQFSEHSFLLESNLDLSNETNFYIPYFGGEFNGNGNSINNFSLDIGFFSYAGLFGVTNDAVIRNLGICDTYIVGKYYVGGLAGTSFYSTIDNCYTSGYIDGTYAGGLIGVIWSNSLLMNCGSLCLVNGGNQIGGLVGSNRGNSVINFCYSAGFVSGDNNVGGLVGSVSNSNTYNSFWDIDGSGQTISAGGTGKTSAEMQNVATYTDLSTIGLDEPWDFVDNPFDDISNEDYWDIDGGINSGYPFLTATTVNTFEEEIAEILERSKLIGNYPNPFNPSTTISFEITAKDAKNAKIEIYNLKGQKIKKLEIMNLKLGINSVIWNGTDDFDKPVSSGVYLYKLNVNNKMESVKKCLMLK